MPSGPSSGLILFLFIRSRSPAPPGRGLNAPATAAAFHSEPATSPLVILALIIGPRPGRLPSKSLGEAGDDPSVVDPLFPAMRPGRGRASSGSTGGGGGDDVLISDKDLFGLTKRPSPERAASASPW